MANGRDQRQRPRSVSLPTPRSNILLHFDWSLLADPRLDEADGRAGLRHSRRALVAEADPNTSARTTLRRWSMRSGRFPRPVESVFGPVMC